MIAESRPIPEEPVELNYHNHDVSVQLNADIDTALIQTKQTFAGHNALPYLPIFILLDADKQKESSKQIMAINGKEEPMDHFTVQNNSFATISLRKPLILEATIHSSSFIEKAGNKYLLKIGELIGPQSEMYQEKQRQFDLEIPNPHQYTRTITMTIPDNYKVSNVDKLNMNVNSDYNGKEACKFISSYKLTGQQLEVKVFEIYRNSFTPITEYESYRKVINAAADFNKIVIVLEKK